jgi:transposase
MRRRRYPSDMSDAEWTLIEPLLPVPACETPGGGRPEKHPRREIVDAIRYLVDTGCKWRALPADYPPWRTVWGFMARWAACGVIGQIRDHLAGRIRRQMGKGPRAVATIIDSQSVKAASTVGKDSRGYDAGKKTSDAKNVSSGEGEAGFSRGREGYGLVERDAVIQAVVEAADHPVEEVPLGGCVPVSGLASAVVVSPRSG